MLVRFLDRQPLLERLNELGLDALAHVVQDCCQRRFSANNHGKLTQWQAAWEALPRVDSRFDLTGPVVRVSGLKPTSDEPIETDQLKQNLLALHPWRKGPLELLGVPIDAEWRSDLKWNRFADAVDFRHKRVLDVGSGNGYYGWRMLGAGAQWVLGCEPYLLSVVQYEVFRKYWPGAEQHWIVPLADSDLPRDLRAFDLTCSMGVLYHRPSPIEHLQILHGTLRPGGQLVLETLIVDGSDRQVLVPEERYAKMRNVWFLPSLPLLQRWLRRTGFVDIQVLDVTRTSTQEQRATEWMAFESLADFLDPHDSGQTIEGYPAPTRALLLARRRSVQ